MVRSARVLLLVAILLGLAAPASASSGDWRRDDGPGHQQLSQTLGSLWTTVFRLPKNKNPFTSTNFCIPLPSQGKGRILVPFAPTGTDRIDCTVRTGTRVFVAAWTSECSTIEDDPYFARGEPALRKCARSADARIATPTVTLDGRPVRVTEVVTPLLKFVLHQDNIFDKPAGTRGQSVGHGWVALLRPLAAGRTHTIILRTHGVDVFDNPVNLTNTTTITVAR